MGDTFFGQNVVFSKHGNAGVILSNGCKIHLAKEIDYTNAKVQLYHNEIASPSPVVVSYARAIEYADEIFMDEDGVRLAELSDYTRALRYEGKYDAYGLEMEILDRDSLPVTYCAELRSNKVLKFHFKASSLAELEADIRTYVAGYLVEINQYFKDMT